MKLEIDSNYNLYKLIRMPNTVVSNMAYSNKGLGSEMRNEGIKLDGGKNALINVFELRSLTSASLKRDPRVENAGAVTVG